MRDAVPRLASKQRAQKIDPFPVCLDDDAAALGCQIDELAAFVLLVGHLAYQLVLHQTLDDVVHRCRRYEFRFGKFGH